MLVLYCTRRRGEREGGSLRREERWKREKRKSGRRKAKRGRTEETMRD